MPNTCGDCRFNQGGYCIIKDKNVSDSSKCSDFEER